MVCGKSITFNISRTVEGWKNFSTYPISKNSIKNYTKNFKFLCFNQHKLLICSWNIFENIFLTIYHIENILKRWI